MEGDTLGDLRNLRLDRSYQASGNTKILSGGKRKEHYQRYGLW